MTQADLQQAVTITSPSTKAQAKVPPDPVIDGRPLLPYPNGWFAVCLSDELKPGDVRNVPFMGGELVVYRTHSGSAHVIEPYCPHLGAHLGHGGNVDGENLVCPFHHLSFDADGWCVGAPGGCKPPPARLKHWRAQERNGAVLVWRDKTGQAPAWEIPETDTTGFSRAKGGYAEIDGYPHDIAENSADLTHFATLHGLTDVRMTSYEEEDHRMVFHLTGLCNGWRIVTRATVYGLGHVLGESEMPALGIQVKTRAFSTPIAPLKWTFRWTDLVRVPRLDSLPELLRRPIYALLVAFVHRWCIWLNAPDFAIWSHRRYVNHPKLIGNEAPIVALRRWMMRFYPMNELESVATASTCDLQEIRGAS